MLTAAVGSTSITMMGVPGFTPTNVWSAGRTTANPGASIWQVRVWTPSSANRYSLPWSLPP
ncbi:MAG TPA: hypothetical protein VNG51_21440 [Ktedonobacteraceae bacterium]|nr:hypothetical protein [Ktedonobacteraceae bacterium]